jgi:hypothetical protein
MRTHWFFPLLALAACDAEWSDDPQDLDDDAPSELPLEEAGPPTLAVAGTCPGPMTLSITGANPQTGARLFRAQGLGAATIPAGPCMGWTLGINNTNLVWSPIQVTTIGGTASWTFNVGAGGCGQRVQAVVFDGACSSSNIIQL